MCELMAYNFAQPIIADFSIREFGLRDADNADGWGVAWYPDRSLALIKETGKWQASPQADFLESYNGLRSEIAIAHVRHMTVGLPTRADTHPFAREWNGVEYCFAHNGTIKNAFDLPLGRFRPVGRTDSEQFFCHLLDEIASWKKPLSEPETWPRLHQKLSEHNRGGTINMLLSDGQRLYCYHDVTAWKGLHLRKVIIQDLEHRALEDADMHLKLKPRAKGQHNSDSDQVPEPVNYGIVVATRPLSPTGWESFLPGELLVLENGAISFSSHRGNRASREMTKAS